MHAIVFFSLFCNPCTGVLFQPCVAFLACYIGFRLDCRDGIFQFCPEDLCGLVFVVVAYQFVYWDFPRVRTSETNSFDEWVWKTWDCDAVHNGIFSGESVSDYFGLDQIENNDFLMFFLIKVHRFYDFLENNSNIQTVRTKCSASVDYWGGFCIVVARCLFRTVEILLFFSCLQSMELLGSYHWLISVLSNSQCRVHAFEENWGCSSMPLLRRKPFALVEPPEDLKPDELVHQIRFTKEIFRDYLYPI